MDLIKILKMREDSIIPQKASVGSAGFDLYASIESSIIIKPFERRLIANGFAMFMPNGYEAQIRSRSGLSLKSGIIVLTTGTIDSDYRGEISTLLFNVSDQEFIIEPRMRIAQMVISTCYSGGLIEVNSREDLGDTIRNEGGWGSTGL